MSTHLTTDQTTDDQRSVAARKVSFHRADPTQDRTTGSARPESGLPVEVLADIAVGLGRAEQLWRPHATHDPLSRTSVRLIDAGAYEVWLLGWTPGQQVDPHDHGGANAAFLVLEGELTELRYGFAGTTTRRWSVGNLATVPTGVVHDVVNEGAGNATSLHVYSNPLRTMTYYDHDGSPRHTELVEQVPALVTSADEARALHPARGGR